MGHDLSIIGKHKLNVNSPKELAIDISERIKAKVKFRITYWDSNFSEGYGDYVCIEKFTVGESFQKEYHLTLWTKDDIDPQSLETCYEDNNFERLELEDPNDTDLKSLNCEIGIDSLFIHCKTNQRWYGFICWITDPAYIFDGYSETCGEWMEKQRQIIWDNLIPFGGHEVLLFSDQGPLQNFVEDIYTKGFEQMRAEMIDIVGKEKTRYLPRELQGYETKNIHEDSKNFQLLYDDFPEKNEK